MMQVHEMFNLTPFTSQIVFTKTGDGGNLVSGILKACFMYDDHGVLLPAQREQMLPIMLADVYYGEPGQTGIRYPSDIAPGKRGTDIIINGHAYGHGKAEITCGFSVGHLEKILNVSGDRYWSKRIVGHHILGPLPFDRMQLTYENAFGGSFEHPKQGNLRCDENPVGKGFGAGITDKTPLPNIEYKDMLITSVKQKPRPAGFGAIAPFWKQRAAYAGTHDDAWKTNIFPARPDDFDPRFYNAAPEDQICHPKLTGGEHMALTNLHPQKSKLEFILPDNRYRCMFRVKNTSDTLTMTMDTCLIEPDENRLTLVYSSSFPIDCDTRYLKSVHFEESHDH